MLNQGTVVKKIFPHVAKHNYILHCNNVIYVDGFNSKYRILRDNYYRLMKYVAHLHSMIFVCQAL